MAEVIRPSVFLITGARKGIGAHLVEYYLAQGHSVVGCSRGAASHTSERYLHFSLDVSDEQAVKRMFAEISDAHGRLDVLINNAGTASMNLLLLTPVKKAREIIETNFIGTFLMCREAARVMRKNRFGRIVNLTSVAAPLKLKGEAVYAASKAAVVSFTEIAARELADLGITVNAIGPAPVRTDLIKNVPHDKIQEIIDRQAVKRFGEFRDISNVIDFFIRPESDFITGQTIFLGGV
jgi:3-oxoacyl-[acyl-carrier protein] reductase